MSLFPQFLVDDGRVQSGIALILVNDAAQIHLVLQQVIKCSSEEWNAAGLPPIHMPFFLDAAILSRIRSAVTSRSNRAKDSST